MENDDIKPIYAPALPFGLDDKIFYTCDEEGNQIGEPHSYNDWLKQIEDISGVSEDLMGQCKTDFEDYSFRPNSYVSNGFGTIWSRDERYIMNKMALDRMKKFECKTDLHEGKE